MIYSHSGNRRNEIEGRLSLFFLVLASCFFVGCSRPSVIYDLSRMNYTFFNQDNSKIHFPSAYKGKIAVLSLIYTHCPDVCPLTTLNMQHLQDTLSKMGVKDVQFVTMTFDPDRDTPSVLRDYAVIRGINFSGWDFLTGTKANTDSVLYSIDFRYFPGDSSITKEGGLIYYITHTDKSYLMDRYGRIRGTYSGSQLDTKEIVKDIKALE